MLFVDHRVTVNSVSWRRFLPTHRVAPTIHQGRIWDIHGIQWDDFNKILIYGMIWVCLRMGCRTSFYGQSRRENHVFGGLVKLGVPPKPMIIGFPSKRIRLFWWLPSSKLTVRPWQIGVGRLVSIKNWWFSGSMLIYQGVIPWVTLFFGNEKETSPAAAGLWPIRQDWYRKGWVGGCQHGDEQ